MDFTKDHEPSERDDARNIPASETKHQMIEATQDDEAGGTSNRQTPSAQHDSERNNTESQPLAISQPTAQEQRPSQDAPVPLVTGETSPDAGTTSSANSSLPRTAQQASPASVPVTTTSQQPQSTVSQPSISTGSHTTQQPQPQAASVAAATPNLSRKRLSSSTLPRPQPPRRGWASDTSQPRQLLPTPSQPSMPTQEPERGASSTPNTMHSPPFSSAPYYPPLLSVIQQPPRATLIPNATNSQFQLPNAASTPSQTNPRPRNPNYGSLIAPTAATVGLSLSAGPRGLRGQMTQPVPAAAGCPRQRAQIQHNEQPRELPTQPSPQNQAAPASSTPSSSDVSAPRQDPQSQSQQQPHPHQSQAARQSSLHHHTGNPIFYTSTLRYHVPGPPGQDVRLIQCQVLHLTAASAERELLRHLEQDQPQLRQRAISMTLTRLDGTRTEPRIIREGQPLRGAREVLHAEIWQLIVSKGAEAGEEMETMGG